MKAVSRSERLFAGQRLPIVSETMVIVSVAGPFVTETGDSVSVAEAFVSFARGIVSVTMAIVSVGEAIVSVTMVIVSVAETIVLRHCWRFFELCIKPTDNRKVVTRIKGIAFPYFYHW